MNRPRELNRIPARVVCAALLVCAALVACTHGAARPSPAYGLVRGDAVEVCLPPGENIYLKALRCPDGAPPHVERQGSVGTRTHLPNPDDPRVLLQMDPAAKIPRGDPDLHIVDAFRATCGARESTLFLDMYHCGGPQPRAAPEGFSLEE